MPDRKTKKDGIVTIDTSTAGAIESGQVDLQDLEAVRLLVCGDSVIDWHRLDLYTKRKVKDYLSLLLLDMDDPIDRRRLSFVFNEAVNYLEENLSLTFPPELREPADVQDIFIMASQYGGFRRQQILACVVLKIMHVINHMEAADLKFRTSVSEAHLLEMAERRIVAAAGEMHRQNIPIVAYYGSHKTRNSVITKLLAKRGAFASPIFDKLRFRIITQERSHIFPVIAWLARNVFPFNYVIPGQSHNNLIHLDEMFSSTEELKALSHSLQEVRDSHSGLHPEANPFSGSSYRMINFVVDYPIRIDEFLDPTDTEILYLLGRTVFVLVEFQILDKETARRNEEGDNAHRLYKMRQRQLVNARLRRGKRHLQRIMND